MAKSIQLKLLNHILCRSYCVSTTEGGNRKSKNIVEFMKTSPWKSVVGLEVHVQISSQSKLFSGAKVDFTSPVNTSVALLDAAIPGTLPVLNKKCVETAVLTSLALNCKVNKESSFDRKHYFYSDLPAGYQITQLDHPVAEKGEIKFNVFTPSIHNKAYEKSCNLRQIQLEQDSGKTIHDDFEDRSLVDLNRAGIALMELVFDPDLSDGEEAAGLVKELILILECLGASTCRMEEGAIRVDANVSVCPKDSKELGVRSEVKNIGSIRGVANAVNYEIRRQIALLEEGGVVVNETRAYDGTNKTTVSMRDKENIQDYRFMPEPNLLPLRLEESFIKQIESNLPLLPNQLRDQLKEKYNLNTDFVNRLSRDTKLLTLFYKLINEKSSRSPQSIAQVIVLHLMAVVNKHELDLDESDININHIGSIIDEFESYNISIHNLLYLIEKTLIENDIRTPNEIINQELLSIIKDEETIIKIVKEYLDNNKDKVDGYIRRSEKKRVKIFSSIVIELEELNNHTLNSKLVKNILKESLDKYENENKKEK